MPVPLSPSVFTCPPPHSALAALQAANVNLHLLSEKMATYLMKGVQQNDRSDVSFSADHLSVLQSATWGALIKAASDCMASAPPSPSSSMRKDGYSSHNNSFTHREEMEFATPQRHTLLSSNTTSPITTQGSASKRSTTPSRWIATIPPVGPATTSLSNDSISIDDNQSPASRDTTMVSVESSTSQLNTPQPNPSLKLRPTPSDSSKKLVPQSLALRSPSTATLPTSATSVAPLSSSFSPSSSSNSAVASPAASILRAPIAADLLATPVQLHSTPSSLKGTPVSLSKMRAELASVSLGTGATPLRANPSQRLHMKEHAIRSLQHTPAPMTVEHAHHQQQQHEEYMEEAKRPILTSEPLAPSSHSALHLHSPDLTAAVAASASRRSLTPSRAAAAIVPPSDSESDAEEMEQLIAFKMRVDPSPMSASMRATSSTSSSNAASKYQAKQLSASSPYAIRHHTSSNTTVTPSSVSKAPAVVHSVLSSDEAASVQMPSHFPSPDSSPLHTRTKSHQRSKAYSSDEDEEEDRELAAKAQQLFNQHRQHAYLSMNGEDKKLSASVGAAFSPSQSFPAASTSATRSIPSTPMQDFHSQQERAYDRHKYSDVKRSKHSSDSEESD